MLLVAATQIIPGQALSSVQESNYAKAKRIVYSIFPSDTRAAALRVVGCETGYSYTPWSYNKSGASGYFQILTGNAGRELWYDGGKLVIQSYVNRVNMLFNPWYNTLVALYMSKGGTDWGEWTCKP